MATSRLHCPICAEDFDDIRHVLHDLRYRRFPCGEQGCRREFYTEIERTAHATVTQHQESFRSLSLWTPRMHTRVLHESGKDDPLHANQSQENVPDHSCPVPRQACQVDDQGREEIVQEKSGASGSSPSMMCVSSNRPIVSRPIVRSNCRPIPIH
ncbi:hypothetical protein GCK72_008252 [Caenorhabditis remanei]|uniref:Uncharacterized protein n=1 Tax=Caenorhabditis remanei TaxID=31234 RepID=A0A6A5GZR3_CAERE|nr:hypothetical protein GCK72_008252 [Caenorhabditis remanei]KAF1760006.1 hypothetical protein GCK72_008252 [Caenorhabditis remanei]